MITEAEMSHSPPFASWSPGEQVVPESRGQKIDVSAHALRPGEGKSILPLPFCSTEAVDARCSQDGPWVC